jgi:transposase-like protein
VVVYIGRTMGKVNLTEVFIKFPTNEHCLTHLEELRWQGRPVCPHCGSSRHTAYQKEHRYRCNGCSTNFSVTVKTLFHKTHVDLRKWYFLIAIVMESRKRLPRVQFLAEQTQVNKNTVTRMVRQIRSAITADFGLLISITDEVTKDE